MLPPDEELPEDREAGSVVVGAFEEVLFCLAKTRALAPSAKERTARLVYCIFADWKGRPCVVCLKDSF